MKTTFISIASVLFLVWIGGLIGTSHSHKNDQRAFQKELELYLKSKASHQNDSINLLSNIKAPRNSISYSASSASSAYMSASQGIEVYLKGLSWRGHFIDAQTPITDTLRKKYDALYKQTIDKIEFDPDYENSGYPDLLIEVKSAPSFYKPGLFSSYLANKDPQPYKSIELNSCGKHKATMDLWLVSFDLTFRIEPNDNFITVKETTSNDKHVISHLPISHLKKQKEYNNMRYDRLSVLLEFKPKNFCYLLQDNNSWTSPLNPTPKIGIGAVECIQFSKVGEKGINNAATRLGVQLEQGKSIPLYPQLDHLVQQIAYRSNKNKKQAVRNLPIEQMVSKFENLVDIEDGKEVFADTSFFNQSKYSLIDIKNLGSWKQKKSWFLANNEYKADYFHVKFLVHLYVIGEWLVKDENIAKFEARPPTSITKPGVLDYIFPDFNLGIG